MEIHGFVHAVDPFVVPFRPTPTQELAALPETLNCLSPVFLSVRTNWLSIILAVMLESFVCALILSATAFKESPDVMSKVNSLAVPSSFNA